KKWDNRNFQPKALVLFNPVINTGPEGYGYKRIGEAYKSISPIDNIPKNPYPTILFFGTEDKIISVKQAKLFCNLLEKKGGVCELKFYNGQGHGFFNYKRTENFIQTVREADRFLKSIDLIGGKPNLDQWIQENKDQIKY